jgi:hypothetical protein
MDRVPVSLRVPVNGLVVADLARGGAIFFLASTKEGEDQLLSRVVAKEWCTYGTGGRDGICSTEQGGSVVLSGQTEGWWRQCLGKQQGRVTLHGIQASIMN